MRGDRRQKGVITVFVTLIMVPVVVITGLMVDVARLKAYSSQAVMAADSYGEAVLSEYDNLLKELYGLFSVTQNEKGLAELEALKQYTIYSFHPDADGKGLGGFMPYKDMDVELSYEKVDGASLSNGNVLMTQISDFMKFRIVEELLSGEDENVLDTLSSFDKMNADMDAMEDRTAITDSSQKVLEEVDDYFHILEKINDYPSFIKEEEKRYEDYGGELREIATGSEYGDYVYYLEHQEECEEAIAKKARIDAAAASEEGTEEELTEEEERLIGLKEKAADYGETIAVTMEPLQEAAWDFTGIGKRTDYDAVLDQIVLLEKSAKKLDVSLRELDHQITQLKGELGGCTQKVKDGIEEEIRGLEEILALSEDFLETYNLIEPVNQDRAKSEDNKAQMEEKLVRLDEVLGKLINGEHQPGLVDWPATISFDWYSFREDKDHFYRELERICGSQGSGGDKDAGKKKQKEADRAREEAENALKEEDETTDARDIPESLSAELLASGASGGEVPSLFSYFSGGLSFHAVGNVGTHLIDKFLVTSYDFGMFSSRVSGLKPEDDGEDGEDGEGGGPAAGETDDGNAYHDVSLTGYKMSRDINYLYGAELEYLLGGHDRSKDNLNETRNIICGVRLTMNFVATYTIDEINKAIRGIADAAASAVAASGVGAAVAPLVRVAVSGALRAAIATMETAADWTALKERKKVVFMKTEMGDLESDLSKISGLLEGKTGEGGSRSEGGFQPDYEDYLYVLLCLMLDSNTLMSRTANLITLNMNQAQNAEDTLSALTFKMSDTVTAVQSTCKVRSDFVVVPENFMKMYLSGTSTDSLIQVLEDSYLGYSIIRGY